MVKKIISILLVISMLMPTLALANTQEIEGEQSSNAITLTQEEMQMLFDNQTLSNNDQQTLQIALLNDTQLKETEGERWKLKKWMRRAVVRAITSAAFTAIVLSGGGAAIAISAGMGATKTSPYYFA